MKISIIVPVGNREEWAVCEASLKRSIAAYAGAVEAEILPCFDLKHKGAWLVRNKGLKKASGDWIAWVDCDDVVEECWFAEIAAAVESHPDVELVQFDATEVKNGKERPLRYGCAGMLRGEAFARKLLRNDGMPAWLWTRCFKATLFEGCVFVGRVKQDYRMFLQILPRIGSVWSIEKRLYRYNRHGHGLSNYTQQMDYGVAGEEFEALILRLPRTWHHDGFVGLALTMADVARHSKVRNGSQRWVRKYFGHVVRDWHVPLRLKLKTLLAALGI